MDYGCCYQRVIIAVIREFSEDLIGQGSLKYSTGFILSC